MSEDELTEAERRYLDDLEKLPTTVKSRVVWWLLELVPSIGFFCYGLYADSRFFIVLGFLTLLYFAVWRMIGQFRGFRMMAKFRERGEIRSGKQE